jgi:uncharacterized membrane protein YkvA (DUF1232 family)
MENPGVAIKEDGMRRRSPGSGDASAAEDERRVLTEVLPKLKRVLASVPFAEEVLAAYYAVLDRRTSPVVRVTLVGALAYFLLPTDLVPDFIAGLGFTDDAAVLLAALRSVGGAVEDRHREAAQRWLESVRQAA